MKILIHVKKQQSRIMIRIIHRIMISLRFLKISTFNNQINQQKPFQAPTNNLIRLIKIFIRNKNMVIPHQGKMKIWTTYFRQKPKQKIMKDSIFHLNTNQHKIFLELNKNRS